VVVFTAWFVTRLIQGEPPAPREVKLVRYREIGVELSQLPKAPQALPAPPSLSGRARPLPQKLPSVGGVQASPDLPRASSETKGEAGRQRAQQEVAQTLAGTAASVGSVLQDLSSSLAQGSTTGARRAGGGRRERGVRSGRGAGDLAAALDGAGGSGASGDLQGSGIAGSLVEMATVTDVRGGSGGSGTGTGGPGGTSAEAGGTSSPYRSDASLLAVVRKYAPAIQYCSNSRKTRASRGRSS
jgi:hypothetical protein